MKFLASRMRLINILFVYALQLLHGVGMRTRSECFSVKVSQTRPPLSFSVSSSRVGLFPLSRSRVAHHFLYIEEPTTGPHFVCPWNLHGIQLWLPGNSTIKTPAVRAPGPKCPFLLNEAGGQGWDAPSRHILSWLPSGVLSHLSSLSPNSLFHQHLHYIRILALLLIKSASHLPVSATVNMPASCVSCSLAPGGSSLSLAIMIPSPAHCRKSLFFSLNVQVNFYRLFIQPLYWLACYLLRKCSPQRERVGTQSNSLGQEGKTLHRVRGRGRNSEGPERG